MISKEFVKDRVADFLKVSPQDIPDGLELSSLIADSFMIVELMIELQETCAVRLKQQDIKNVSTVGDLTALIAAFSAGHQPSQNLPDDASPSWQVSPFLK